MTANINIIFINIHLAKKCHNRALMVIVAGLLSDLGEKLTPTQFSYIVRII